MAKHIKIELTGPGQGQIWVDGEELKRVRAIAFKSQAHTANSVIVEIFTDTLEVTALADVDVQHARLGFQSEG